MCHSYLNENPSLEKAMHSHIDGSVITLVISPKRGLRVQNSATREWIDVEERPGRAVLMTGDLLPAFLDFLRSDSANSPSNSNSNSHTKKEEEEGPEIAICNHCVMSTPLEQFQKRVLAPTSTS